MASSVAFTLIRLTPEQHEPALTRSLSRLDVLTSAERCLLGEWLDRVVADR